MLHPLFSVVSLACCVLVAQAAMPGMESVGVDSMRSTSPTEVPPLWPATYSFHAQEFFNDEPKGEFHGFYEGFGVREAYTAPGGIKTIMDFETMKHCLVWDVLEDGTALAANPEADASAAVTKQCHCGRMEGSPNEQRSFPGLRLQSSEAALYDDDANAPKDYHLWVGNSQHVFQQRYWTTKDDAVNAIPVRLETTLKPTTLSGDEGYNRTIVYYSFDAGSVPDHAFVVPEGDCQDAVPLHVEDGIPPWFRDALYGHYFL